MPPILAAVLAAAVLASGCSPAGDSDDREAAGPSPPEGSPPTAPSPAPEQDVTPTNRPAYWGALLDGVRRAGWESLGGDDATLLVEAGDLGMITVAVAPGDSGDQLGAASPARVGGQDVEFGQLDGQEAGRFECAGGTLTFHGGEEAGAVEEAVRDFLGVAGCSQ